MSATTTILVTDVQTSTEMLRAHGDDAGTAMLTAHLRLVRQVVEHDGGRIAKTLGDGAMALFGSAYAAVRAAVALQQQVDHASKPPLGLRVGCNVGEVIDTRDDVFGSAVVIAHRLCAHAAPGEILASDLVRMLVGARTDVTFEPVGPIALKGFGEPVTVSRIPWTRLPDSPAPRVVVADDAPLIRSGVVRLLSDEGFEVVGEATDATQLLALVETLAPDLVVTDIRMPPNHRDEGLRAAAEIRASHPTVAVLVLSQHVEARAAHGLLDDLTAGVGYLLKERVSDVDEFLAACRAILGGGRVIDPLVTQELLATQDSSDQLDRLSDRERDVLDLMAQGLSNSAIAERLFISPKTVESHVGTIFTKLDLTENPDEHRRVTAVIQWLDARS